MLLVLIFLIFSPILLQTYSLDFFFQISSDNIPFVEKHFFSNLNVVFCIEDLMSRSAKKRD